jgi:hypothetical protein
MDNKLISLYEFAYHSLTEQQQYRVNMKYDLKKQLNINTGCKRHVYKAIADKYGYTMETVEYIANHKLKK